jgi:excisionase family DNA binding protein
MSEMELLTPEEVAQRLQVKARTVQEWLRSGRLVGLKLGKLWRIRPNDLVAFLDRQQTTASTSGRPEAAAALSAEERAARVDALLGKYTHAHSTVDEFCRRKQEEIDLENRRWEDQVR